MRLKANYVPPHWRKRGDGRWDGGYEKTGYFLDWLEDRFGVGSVPQLNQELAQSYAEADFWPALFGPGNSVDKLWEAYARSIEQSDEVESQAASA